VIPSEQVAVTKPRDIEFVAGVDAKVRAWIAATASTPTLSSQHGIADG
jgi:hypothetical protein